jgi:hypothetical protein
MGESGMTAQVEKKSEAVTPPPTVTPAAYNSLVAAARLRDIRLLKSEFVLDPDGIDAEDSWKLNQSCEIQQAQFSPETEMLLTFVEASAICKIKNKKVVTVRCRYLVAYEVQGDPEELAINAFAKRVARFAAYPYFRAHVAEIASQAGLRLPPLPIIKEVKYIPQVTSEAKQA